MNVSKIAIIAAMGAMLYGPDAMAACAPGGSTFDGTTITVDTTGCNLVAVDSVTNQGTFVNAGTVATFDVTTGDIAQMTPVGVVVTDNVTQATILHKGGLETIDASGNATVVAPDGVVTNGAFVATDGATQQTVVHQGGVLTQDASGNASVVAPTVVGVTDGTNTTVVVAGGVATTGTVSANAVTANTVVAGFGDFGALATQDSGGNVYGNVGDTLTAHSALLSQHTARLDQQEKGIAIAMALPDLYLSDKERFSIAGNLGGFGGETAIGFGAIARIDNTFALTGKLGADTEFKEFGWSVGARAGF